MQQITTYPMARRLSARLSRANRGRVVQRAPGQYARAMSGAFTDRVKSSLPLIAVFAGGLIIGYVARNPIGKVVKKVT